MFWVINKENSLPYALLSGALFKTYWMLDFYRLLFFFFVFFFNKINSFGKTLATLPSGCQIILIKIRAWVQTVRKSKQQTILEAKEFLTCKAALEADKYINS